MSLAVNHEEASVVRIVHARQMRERENTRLAKLEHERTFAIKAARIATKGERRHRRRKLVEITNAALMAGLSRKARKRHAERWGG